MLNLPFGLKCCQKTGMWFLKWNIFYLIINLINMSHSVSILSCRFICRDFRAQSEHQSVIKSNTLWILTYWIKSQIVPKGKVQGQIYSICKGIRKQCSLKFTKVICSNKTNHFFLSLSGQLAESMSPCVETAPKSPTNSPSDLSKSYQTSYATLCCL